MLEKAYKIQCNEDVFKTLRTPEPYGDLKAVAKKNNRELNWYFEGGMGRFVEIQFEVDIIKNNFFVNCYIIAMKDDDATPYIDYWEEMKNKYPVDINALKRLEKYKMAERTFGTYKTFKVVDKKSYEFLSKTRKGRTIGLVESVDKNDKK